MTKTSFSRTLSSPFPLFVPFIHFLLPFIRDDDGLGDLGETMSGNGEVFVLRLCCPWKYIFNLDAEGNFDEGNECSS